jgi:hypothetical protein
VAAVTKLFSSACSDAGHEDDQAFEELAGDGERPDARLHAGEREFGDLRAVRPHRDFVDVFLHRLAVAARCPCASGHDDVVHDSTS